MSGVVDDPELVDKEACHGIPIVASPVLSRTFRKTLQLAALENLLPDAEVEAIPSTTLAMTVRPAVVSRPDRPFDGLPRIEPRPLHRCRVGRSGGAAGSRHAGSHGLRLVPGPFVTAGGRADRTDLPPAPWNAVPLRSDLSLARPLGLSHLRLHHFHARHAVSGQRIRRLRQRAPVGAEPFPDRQGYLP